MKNDYGGVIWTRHALGRLTARNISQGNAWVAFTRPDKFRWTKVKGIWIFEKVLKGWEVEVVARKNERRQWIIMSVWAKPVFWQKEYEAVKKRGWWSRLFRQILFGDYR